MYRFSIFATVRGPNRLHPRPIYRVRLGCLPAVQIFLVHPIFFWAGANLLLAVKCCSKNKRWTDFLKWRLVAPQPADQKK